MRTASWIGLTAAGIVVFAFSYQNCSQVRFAENQETSAQVDSQSQPPPSEPPPGPVNCPSGQTYDGFKCVTPIPGCLSYALVSPDANRKLSIPARNANQICYYTRLFRERRQGLDLPGDHSLPLNMEIIAADHDSGEPLPGGGYLFKNKRHPTILETVTLTVYLNGERDVILTADSTLEAPLFVDNVIWLEFTLGGTTQLWLRGTWDIFPRTSVNGPFLPITYRNQEIRITDPEFAGRTDNIEEVSPANLKGYFPVQQPVSFKASALDCGGDKAKSNGFLLFR